MFSREYKYKTRKQKLSYMNLYITIGAGFFQKVVELKNDKFKRKKNKKTILQEKISNKEV